MSKEAEANEKKQFSLKAHESSLLAFTKQHHDAVFSGILSTIVMERLGYTVTENTKFSLNADLTEITVEELQELPDTPDEPKAPEESVVKAAK